MELDSPVRWAEWAPTAPAGLRLLAHPKGIPAAQWPRPAPNDEVTLAIGPEGGFTEGEVEAGRAMGWRVVGLGPTVLRIETAALAATAILLAHCEEPDR
jgi:16S rRNA (uracil1498-N3)-methyltransferase